MTYGISDIFVSKNLHLQLTCTRPRDLGMLGLNYILLIVVLENSVYTSVTLNE